MEAVLGGKRYATVGDEWPGPPPGREREPRAAEGESEGESEGEDGEEGEEGEEEEEGVCSYCLSGGKVH
eukprot:scaffold79908_cov39-Phaeocystis_antarctica.AAC.2